MNRSIIQLLHCLGIEKDYFIDKQRQAKELIDVDIVKEKLTLYKEQYKQIDSMSAIQKKELKTKIRQLF